MELFCRLQLAVRRVKSRSLVTSCGVLLAACHPGEGTVAQTDSCSGVLFSERLAITPNSALMKAGDSLQLSAAVPRCNPVTRSQTFLWSATDTTVVVVDLTGLVHARRGGTTTVIAIAVPDSAEIQRGAIVVTVSP
jgi:uncharacterized protein YjdB